MNEETNERVIQLEDHFVEIHLIIYNLPHDFFEKRRQGKLKYL